MRLAFWRRPTPTRLELRCLTYAAADALIKETHGAWTIAPEEDTNRVLGMVYLERLERGTPPFTEKGKAAQERGTRPGLPPARVNPAPSRDATPP